MVKARSLNEAGPEGPMGGKEAQNQELERESVWPFPILSRAALLRTKAIIPLGSTIELNTDLGEVKTRRGEEKKKTKPENIWVINLVTVFSFRNDKLFFF